jgi:hypothetical protein
MSLCLTVGTDPDELLNYVFGFANLVLAARRFTITETRRAS